MSSKTVLVLNIQSYNNQMGKTKRLYLVLENLKMIKTS